jgi:hypothetical protein
VPRITEIYAGNQMNAVLECSLSDRESARSLAASGQPLDHVALRWNHLKADNVIDSDDVEHAAKNRFPLFRSML